MDNKAPFFTYQKKKNTKQNKIFKNKNNIQDASQINHDLGGFRDKIKA